MRGKTPDLFSNHRRDDGGSEFIETRVSRKQFMDDNVWRPLVVQYVYEQGAKGVTLERLKAWGIEREWWQDTAAKHFGEKMRVTFSTGLQFVPVYPGISTLRHIRVVHPAYVQVTFHHATLEGDNQRVRSHMMRQDYVRQKSDHRR